MSLSSAPNRAKSGAPGPPPPSQMDLDRNSGATESSYATAGSSTASSGAITGQLKRDMLRSMYQSRHHLQKQQQQPQAQTKPPPSARSAPGDCETRGIQVETSAVAWGGVPGPLPPLRDRGDGSLSTINEINPVPLNNDRASARGAIYHHPGFEEDPRAFDHWEEHYQAFYHLKKGRGGEVVYLIEKGKLPHNKRNGRGIPLFNERACLQIGKDLAMGKGGLICRNQHYCSSWGHRPWYLKLPSMALAGEAVKKLFLPFALLDNESNTGWVERIDLSRNRKMGLNGIVGLSPVLRSRHLKCLSIANVRLGDQGAEALASILRDCADESRLDYLDVSFNEVNDRGARELARALRHLPSLRRLNLGCNCIREYSSFSPILLAEGGNGDPTLEVLELCGNPIDDECLARLAEDLQGNRGHIAKLVFAGNKNITDEGPALLFKMLHNVSGLDPLWDSNHSLAISFRMDGCPKLSRALAGASEINETKLSRCMKVWHKFFAWYLPHHFHICQEIESLDRILVPRAFAWVANNRRVQPPHYQCHDALYHFLGKLPTHWL